MSNGLPAPLPLLSSDDVEVAEFAVDVVDVDKRDDVSEVSEGGNVVSCEVSCEVVSCDVGCAIDVVGGGTVVNVVAVAVDGMGRVDVSTAGGVADGIKLKLPIVLVVVKLGTVAVVRIVVLLLGVKVKLLPTHRFKIRLPRCAAYNRLNARESVSTMAHWSCVSSSVCPRPATQEREQLNRLEKSAVVHPSMAAWYTRLHATGSTPSWTAWKSLSETADVVEIRVTNAPK